MDILEIRNGVLDGGVATWESFDAAAVWEPHSTAFQLSELTHNLTNTPALGVVAISDEFITKHPEATVQFLIALVRAWDFFSSNPERVMRWYNDDTHLAVARLNAGMAGNQSEKVRRDRFLNSSMDCGHRPV